ncbi:MAG: hypothetical protein ACM3MK_13365, partial [Chitinophagales bacterium]
WRFTMITEVEERWTKDHKGIWQYLSSKKDHYKLVFTGKDSEKIDKITWKYKGNSGEVWLTDYLGHDGVINGTTGGEGGPIIVKDETLTITVCWQGKTETMTAKHQQYSKDAALENLYQLGLAFNGKVTKSNSKVILMQIDGEPITLSEWHYFQAGDKVQAVGHGDKLLPTNKDIMHNLIGRKAAVAAAKKAGVYPSEDIIQAYVDEQRRISLKEPDMEALLTGWGIQDDEYFMLMKGIWADSLAIQNWHEKILQGKMHQKPGEGSETYQKRLLKFYDQKTEELIKKAKVVKVTETPETDMLP